MQTCLMKNGLTATIATIAALLLAGNTQAQTSSQSPAPNPPPRLALWIGELLGGGDNTKCLRAEVQADAQPFLTERDVAAWDPAQARWTLDPNRHPGRETRLAMSDRCFVMTLDGKTIRGAVLSQYSARWVRFPVLTIATQSAAEKAAGAGTLSLRLVALFNGADSPPLEAETLARILAPVAGR